MSHSSALLLGFPRYSAAIKIPTSLCAQLLLKGCDEKAGFSTTSNPSGVILGGLEQARAAGVHEVLGGCSEGSSCPSSAPPGSAMLAAGPEPLN